MMSGMKEVRIQSPLNLEYLLLNEMTSGKNTDVVFLCSSGKKVGFVKSLLCSSFPLFHQILPSCESEKFLLKDSQIFVTMENVEAELLEEYLLTSLSGSDTGVVDLRFSEIDSMLKHRQVHEKKEEVNNIGGMFDSLVNDIVEDCIRVRKLETFDSDITLEIDVDDDVEPEQKERLTMSCIKSKSPAQFYRSFTSEPEEVEDTPDLDFDDLEVKMENSITGVDDVIDEFCDSDSSTTKQPLVQVKMDVIKELVDPIHKESPTVTDTVSLQKRTPGSGHIPVEVDSDTRDASAQGCDPASKTDEPLPPSDNVPIMFSSVAETVHVNVKGLESHVIEEKTCAEKLTVDADADAEKQDCDPSSAKSTEEPPLTNEKESNLESQAKEDKAPAEEPVVVGKKKRKRCQLTLVKTKEQIEWESFPEKLGLIRKHNPGKENTSKIPKMTKKTNKSRKTEVSSVPDTNRDGIKEPMAMVEPSSAIPSRMTEPVDQSQPEPPMENKLEESQRIAEEDKSNTITQAGLKQCNEDEPSLLDSIDYLMGDAEGKVEENPAAIMEDDKAAERDADLDEGGEDAPEMTNNPHQGNMIDEEITFNPTRKVVPGPAIIDEDTLPDPGLAPAPQMSAYEPMLPSREWDYSDTEIDEMFQTCLDEELVNTTEYQDAAQEVTFKEDNRQGDEDTVMDQDIDDEAEKTMAENAADTSLKSDVTLGDSYEDHDEYDYEDDEDYDEEITKLETQIDVMKQKAEETLVIPAVAKGEKPKKSKKRRAEETLDEGDSKKSRSEVEVGEFQCYFCDKSFKRVDDLLQHLSQSHFGKQLLSKYPIEADETCSVCLSEDRKRKYVMKDVKNKGPYFYHIGKVHQRVLECLEPHIQADLIQKLNADPSSFSFLTLRAADPSASVSLEEASMKTDVEMPLPQSEDNKTLKSDVAMNKEGSKTEAPSDVIETSNIEKGKKKRGRRSRLNKTEPEVNTEVSPESSEMEKVIPSSSNFVESAPVQTEEPIVNPATEPLSSEIAPEPVKKVRRGRKSKANNMINDLNSSKVKAIDEKEPEASLNASNPSDTDTSLESLETQIVTELDKSDNSHPSKSPRHENLNISRGRSKSEAVPISCSLCDKPEAKWTKGKLMEHLPTHFNKQITEKYDPSYVENGQCVLCVREEKPQPFSCGDVQKKRYNFNRHLSTVHKAALEFLIHEEKHREMIEFLGETFRPDGQQHIGDPGEVVTEKTELTSTIEAPVENTVKTSVENPEEGQVKPAAKKPTRIPRKRVEKSEQSRLKTHEATNNSVPDNNDQKAPVDDSLKDLNLGSTIQVTKRTKKSLAPDAKPIQKPIKAPAESSVPQQDLPEPLSRLSSMLTIEKKPSKVVSAATKNPPAAKSFQCGECPAILESKLGLGKHMKSHLKK